MTLGDLEAAITKVFERFQASHATAPADSGPQYYTRKEVAELLHISLPSVHSLMNKGALKVTKIGSRTLIDAADLRSKISSGAIARYKHI